MFQNQYINVTMSGPLTFKIKKKKKKKIEKKKRSNNKNKIK